MFKYYIALLFLAFVADSAETWRPVDSLELSEIIENEVAETFEFSGMALYLNQVTFFSLNENKLNELTAGSDELNSGEIEKIIVVGRFNAMVIDLNKSQISFDDGQLLIDDFVNTVKGVNTYSKNELVGLNKDFKPIKYHHLWWPLALLSMFFEYVLVLLGDMLGQIWALAILVFAVLMKVTFIPLATATSRVQKRTNQVQAVLVPELNAIKSKYDGEQAHVKIMAAHKKLGVSPFFTLKPLMMTLIQIPFLIAIFNTLGEMEELKGASMLWISDLSLPDMMLNLGVKIPMFGEWFNLLPILMTGITLLASFSYGDSQLPDKLVKSQRFRLYMMALVFFVLFFPFPAAMVFYWSLVNLWQLLYQRIIEK